MAPEKGSSDPRPRFWESMSRWPATALVAAVIFCLSELPEPFPPRPPLFPHADKAAHVVEYFALGVFLFRSLRHELSGNSGAAAIIALVAGTGFGALDEWHQRFTDRTADLWDVAADVAGLALALACAWAAGRWRRKHGR